ncbi:MAG: glycosyl hydrolase, partial [Planctomycetes bacterium]|nr:glycosyl hydrolase [Planctomycetota bacterium]
DVWPDEPMGDGAAALRYRFQWNYPLFFSPHPPHALYAAANVLFRSTDRGASWEALSGDLTRDDKTKQGPSGGPITKDNTSVEYYATIFAAAESPLERGVLWTGSDDGLVHVSRDDGKTWANVTPSALPEWARINSVEPHPQNPGGLYLAATRYQLDDRTPYLFRTLDYGATWTRIDAGIEREHFTRVVRADPERAGLLFAGTENGLYASFDDGAHWQRFQLGLPLVPITDLAVKDGDLIAATQGRGYWILDDLTALREATREILAKPLHLFAARAALRRISGGGRASGAVLRYRLSTALAESKDLSLEIRDAEGTVIRRFTRRPSEGEKPSERGGERENLAVLPGEAGLNEFVWNLQWPGAEKPSGVVLWNGDLSGPRALPGTYTAVLSCGAERAEIAFEVRRDPRSDATLEEMQANFAFHREVLALIDRIHRELRTVREVRSQLSALEKRLGAEIPPRLKEASAALQEKMRAAEETLHQTKSESSQDPLNFPVRLNDKLAKLTEMVRGSDRAPTAQARAVLQELSPRAEAAIAQLESLWLEELAKLNALIAELGVPALSLPPTRTASSAEQAK